MRFQIVYNEALGRWIPEGSEGEALTEPLRAGQLLAWLVNEVKVPEEREKRWSKPVDHKTKRQDGTADTPLYEIKAGRVQRIPATRNERNEQQMAELLSILEDRE